MSELARFFLVTLMGVILDIGIAYTLSQGFGVTLWIAATIGFVIAASINYVVHQLWSFQEGSRRLSVVRAGKYAGVAFVTLAARVAVVAMLDTVLAGRMPLLILICGAGASFFVNFTLSKFFVFSEKPAEGVEA
jgi:putative flippase GtrA